MISTKAVAGTGAFLRTNAASAGAEDNALAPDMRRKGKPATGLKQPEPAAASRTTESGRNGDEAGSAANKRRRKERKLAPRRAETLPSPPFYDPLLLPNETGRGTRVHPAGSLLPVLPIRLAPPAVHCSAAIWSLSLCRNRR